MNALYDRVGDQAWSIVFKSLLVMHIMIREGEKDRTLAYLSRHPKFFELDQIKKVKNGDARSLLRYSKYLHTRAKQFANTHVDYVRDEQDYGSRKEGARLRALSIDKGLLREVESVEKQISSLINCKFAEAEINNDIVLTCFRMLVNDLLCLFQALNEGVINILEHYFEMSKYDAQRALEIYKDFVVLTTDVVNYLRVAKHLEYSTKLHVPTIKHAPTALAKSLEEYLNDTNFEVNRTQYIAEKEYKSKSPISSNPKRQDSQSKPKEQPQQLQSQPTLSVSNPWANQINLQPLQVQFTQQPQQIQLQHTANPFLQSYPQNNNAQTQPVLPQLQQTQLPLQQYQTGAYSSQPPQNINPTFTGAGFGGYTNPIQQQVTGNPFLQQQQQLQQQRQQQTLQQQPPQVQQPLESSKTGNNPFALNYKSNTLPSISEQPSQTNSANPFSTSYASSEQSKPSAVNPLVTQYTGTNPFQKQTTGQVKPNATFGGYENLPTTPVFPQTIQEQKTNQLNQQAAFELQQQKTQNQQQQQQQQFQQLQFQHQQQQLLAQQQIGAQNNQFTGFQTNGFVNQRFQQQQAFPQQPQQSQQSAYQSYEGPNLI